MEKKLSLEPRILHNETGVVSRATVACPFRSAGPPENLPLIYSL